MRKRKIKKYGGSFVIQLTHADVQDFGLAEGDVIDIDDLNLLNLLRKKMEETIQIIRNERPNSFETGKAGNRFKIYFDTAEDLKKQLEELKKLNLGEENSL